VKNAAGKFLQGSPDGVTAAAAAAAKTMPADYRVSITNAQGAASYPISSFTYLLIPRQFADPAKGAAVKSFLTWMLEHGESEAKGMDYAPLPAQVQTMVKRTITTIK
jgi:phosphate transport system substrate-binding protein